MRVAPSRPTWPAARSRSPTSASSASTPARRSSTRVRPRSCASAPSGSSRGWSPAARIEPRWVTPLALSLRPPAGRRRPRQPFLADLAAVLERPEPGPRLGLTPRRAPSGARPRRPVPAAPRAAGDRTAALPRRRRLRAGRGGAASARPCGPTSGWASARPSSAGTATPGRPATRSSAAPASATSGRRRPRPQRGARPRGRRRPARTRSTAPPPPPGRPGCGPAAGTPRGR